MEGGGQDLGLGNGAGGETITIRTENGEERAVWGMVEEGRRHILSFKVPMGHPGAMCRGQATCVHLLWLEMRVCVSSSSCARWG